MSYRERRDSSESVESELFGTPATATAVSSGERSTEGTPLVDLQGLNAARLVFDDSTVESDLNVTAVPAGPSTQDSPFGAAGSGYQRQGSWPPEHNNMAPQPTRLGRASVAEGRKEEYDAILESNGKLVNLRRVQKGRCNTKQAVMVAATVALRETPSTQKYLDLTRAIEALDDAIQHAAKLHNEYIEGYVQSLTLEGHDMEGTEAQGLLTVADAWIQETRTLYADSLSNAYMALEEKRNLAPKPTGETGGGRGNLDPADLERILTKVTEHSARETADTQLRVSKEIQEQQTKALTMLQVPSLDCEIFKGTDNENWAAWFSTFEQVYPEDMDAKQRYLALLRKTQGPPLALIKGLEVNNDAYKESIKRLVLHYGQPEQEVNRLQRHFHSLKKVTSTKDYKAFRALYQTMCNMVYAYEKMKIPLSGPITIDTWLTKCPVAVANKYVEACLDDVDEKDTAKRKTGNAKEFLKVVERMVRYAESTRDHEAEGDKKDGKSSDQKRTTPAAMMAMAEGGGRKRGGKAAGKAKPASPQAANGAMALQAMSKPSKKQQKGRHFNVCQGCLKDYNHNCEKCPEFMKLDAADKRRWIWLCKRCNRCLQKGHRASDCTTSKKCGEKGCSQPTSHHTLTHRP